jgi:SAM-dependent methyltransferase
MDGHDSEESRRAWDRIAPGYDRTNTPTQMWLGNEGLRRAGLRTGIRFLDVAAGSGALSIPAARLGAEVLAVDQSPRMLELLDHRARSEGLVIETRVMDGHALTLADGSFDMAGSQFGVMLFPDMPKGIREMVQPTATPRRSISSASSLAPYSLPVPASTAHPSILRPSPSSYRILIDFRESSPPQGSWV